MAAGIWSKLAVPFDSGKATEQGALVAEQYGWLNIADQTLGVYGTVLKRKMPKA